MMNKQSLVFATFVVALATGGCASGGSQAEPLGSIGLSMSVPFSASSVSRQVIQIHSDHPTFSTIDQLASSADNVFEGTVDSQIVIPGAPIGTDEAGDTIFSPPTTEFTVNVSGVFSGGLVVGSSVVVLELGGDDGRALFVSDGGPTLSNGVTSVYFTGPATGGRVAPLAGGSAVGVKNPDGSYTLPADVSDAATEQVVTVDQLLPPAIPASIQITTGDQQSVSTAQPFPIALSGRVLDGSGNSVPGTPVRFEIASGSASFGGTTIANVTSTPDGIATAPQLTAGTISGPVVVTATAGTATAQFLETVTNIAPVASFTATPTSGKAPLPVAFDGSASSDTDGTIVSYAWDFGDGTTSTGITTTHTYTIGGTFSPQLTVTDDDGATNTTSQEIVVAPPNVAPVAAFTATPMVPAALPECGDDHDAADDQDECEDASDYESEEYHRALAPSLLVAFDASASVDTDGTIESYMWDFGDGTTATGVTTTHTYTAAGTFTARLTITDNEGSTDTTTHEITVAAPGFGLRVTDDSGAVVWTVAGLFNNNKTIHVKYSSDGKVRQISGAATDVDPVGVRTNVSFSVIRTEHSSEYTGSIRIKRSDGAVKKFRFQVVGGVTTIAGGGATGQGSSKVCEDHDCAKWTLDWVVNKPLAVVHKERPSGSRGMTRAML